MECAGRDEDSTTVTILEFNPDDLKALCERHHVQRLAIFGSFATGAATPDSDLDILIEFAPGKTPGLRFFTLQRELSELFGRAVDLNTPGFLSRHFRGAAIRHAQDIYVAA